MVKSKHLFHFCYPTRLVLYQHQNSHVAYPGFLSENSNNTRGQYQQVCNRTLFSDYSERRFSTSITLELHLVQPHCARITKHGHHL